jgi:hypothetical protein
MRYVAITTNDERFYLRLETETGGLLIGTEVRADGDTVKPRGADERRRIVSADAISCLTEMRMNWKYAILEPVTDTQPTKNRRHT